MDFIAMSGGVDSSVAAYLTKAQGIPCIGGTMRLNGSSPQDVSDARAVAEALGIGFHVIGLEDAFRADVIDRFLDAYRTGITPSPCIECNRSIKFGHLLRHAQAMGCEHIVTGHYAQIRREADRWLLYKAADGAKDQSYFLCLLTQEQLRHIRFPLGGMTKQQIRQIAQEQGFLNARKRDSQDICFIPDGDLRAFLHAHVPCASGSFLDLEGNIVGQHQGAIGYTCGQRKGLGLAMGAPVYVCSKDVLGNTVTVGPNEALFHRALIAQDWSWFPFPALTAPLRVKAKVRSRMVEQSATVYPEADGRAKVVFDVPQRAITPGQAVVLYDGDMVVGGGMITDIRKEDD